MWNSLKTYICYELNQAYQERNPNLSLEVVKNIHEFERLYGNSVAPVILLYLLRTSS